MNFERRHTQAPDDTSPPPNENGKHTRRIDDDEDLDTGGRRFSKYQHLEEKGMESRSDVHQFEDELIPALEEYVDDSLVPLGKNPPILHTEFPSKAAATKNKPHKPAASPAINAPIHGQSEEHPHLEVDHKLNVSTEERSEAPCSSRRTSLRGPQLLQGSFSGQAPSTTEVATSTTASQSPYHPSSHPPAPSVFGVAAPQPTGTQQLPMSSSLVPNFRAPVAAAIAALVQ
ncbi:hypothetical protein PM082_018144 [Marasmius tenuissimus]|nr:hypothetical protein PM082_018144 [Marasmius tenuissimus]